MTNQGIVTYPQSRFSHHNTREDMQIINEVNAKKYFPAIDYWLSVNNMPVLHTETDEEYIDRKRQECLDKGELSPCNILKAKKYPIKWDMPTKSGKSRLYGKNQAFQIAIRLGLYDTVIDDILGIGKSVNISYVRNGKQISYTRYYFTWADIEKAVNKQKKQRFMDILEGANGSKPTEEAKAWAKAELAKLG
jgi:hypothetical protein